jgi:DMSO/TMAO reductase YedYZ molybdopterin-dependent catalytic subunit
MIGLFRRDMPSSARRLWLIGLFAIATSAWGADPVPLTVSGQVAHPLKLDAATLRGYPADQLVTLTLPGRQPADKPGLVRGVRLKAILDQAGLKVTDHNTAKKVAVVATARDGYAVVFSWSELYNLEAGASVLVLFERDGQPLPDAEGPLALIAGRDTSTGPRHVKWLERIAVKQIVD